jgi:NADPH-dependent ferric siderophore reductase
MTFSTVSIERPASLIRRVRHDLVRREVRVQRIADLSPSLRAITFGSPSLDGFTSMSFDDHVKFIISDAAGREHRRDYTPHHFDASRGELTLWFVLHATGAASDWARRAQVGDAAVVGGPRGSMIIPDTLDWYLLAGDTTALPAMARRLNELPARAQTVVLLQSAQALDQSALPPRAGLKLLCLPDEEALIAAARSVDLPAGEGFSWCAGEAHSMTRLREVLLVERQLPRSHVKVSAYWKINATDFHETLD